MRIVAIASLSACSDPEPVVDEGCEIWLDCCAHACGTEVEATNTAPNLPDCKCFRVTGPEGDCLLEDDGTCDWR